MREELRRRAIAKTKEKLRKELIRRDNIIVQTVRTIDRIDKSVNALVEQLHDWYGLYFPELGRIVEEPAEYLLLVINLKTKENFTEQKIVELVGEKKYRLDVEHAAKTSMGGALKPEDVEKAAEFAQKIQILRNERKTVEDYLNQVMEEEAPNINAVVGPAIGGRLIATAGSLEKFAMFPASTVQVLGAEKALFAHLRKHVKPPKHGIIFQYPKLRGSAPKARGKIARKIAAKLSMASKVDFFHGEFCGDRLAKNLEVEIEKIVKRVAK
jgi:nucleolar protein 56